MKEQLTIVDVKDNESTFSVMGTTETKDAYGSALLGVLGDLSRHPLLRTFAWERLVDVKVPWQPGVEIDKETIFAPEEERQGLIQQAAVSVFRELKDIGMEEEARTVIRGVSAEDEKRHALREAESILKKSSNTLK